MKTRILAAAVLLPLLRLVVLFAPKIFTAILFGAMANAVAEANKSRNSEVNLFIIADFWIY